MNVYGGPVSVEGQNIASLTLNESQTDGFQIAKTNNQRPKTAGAKHTVFKDRRLITLEECKSIFQIIWEGTMAETLQGLNVEGEGYADKKSECRNENKERFIMY